MAAVKKSSNAVPIPEPEEEMESGVTMETEVAASQPMTTATIANLSQVETPKKGSLPKQTIELLNGITVYNY